MADDITAQQVEIRRQAYKQATIIAMNELDELLPQFHKITERVALLRKFVTAGVRLGGADIRDVDSKYVNQWETDEFHSRAVNRPTNHKRR